MTCGCRIDEGMDGREVQVWHGQYAIVYCPLHRSAQELQEALQMIHKAGICAEHHNKSAKFLTAFDWHILRQALYHSEGAT